MNMKMAALVKRDDYVKYDLCYHHFSVALTY